MSICRGETRARPCSRARTTCFREMPTMPPQSGCRDETRMVRNCGTIPELAGYEGLSSQPAHRVAADTSATATVYTNSDIVHRRTELMTTRGSSVYRAGSGKELCPSWLVLLLLLRHATFVAISWGRVHRCIRVDGRSGDADCGVRDCAEECRGYPQHPELQSGGGRAILAAGNRPYSVSWHQLADDLLHRRNDGHGRGTCPCRLLPLDVSWM